jgi:cytochrome c biogenesis protein CcdA
MEPDEAPRRQINIFGRKFHLPQSRWLRIVVGVTLVIFGFLGFLPILGFWMVPLGLVVLSTDIPAVRRLRRRAEVAILRRWRRWRAPADGGGAAS